ncbi:DHA2 family efflux MFS transporter permease subunit [Solirubrobacter soli]|uniref:DHA2 family efflux MFS transporter permease subunit n=1 Tax=Solirubrobacter soli TaxID=363832 RepID=UPI000429006F|nr:DHA2 family efflux MFS transporter permease subunit [Solirubrobacter soli]
MSVIGARQKRLALAAAIMGSFVAGLDATAVNVALPAIREDLGGGLAGQQWVSNAYLLTLGSLILVAGSLGDLYGERRVFSIGVGGFGVVSMLCALAPTIEVLIVGRALQGVFGALLTPSALAVIISTFGPDERGGAIGSWTAWSGIAMVIGPLAGGWLVDTASWRWIFAINVPFVLITLTLVMIAVPKSPGRRDVRLDWLGALLTVLGLAGPVLALIRQPTVGWSSPEVWLVGLTGIALLVAFVFHERRTPQPMLPLELFKRRNFAFGNLQTFAMYGGLGTMFFFLTLFLQQVAGYEALQAGLATLPTTVVSFLLAKRAGRLADRYGPRLFMGCGPLVAAVGIALMLRMDQDVDYWTELFPALLIFSFGLVATVAPLTATVLADADENNAGIASGVNNAIARVASLLCVAGIGAVVSAVYVNGMGGAAGETLEVIPGMPQSITASVDAFHVGIGICATLVALGGVLGLVGIRNPRREVRCEDCAAGAYSVQAPHSPIGREPQAAAR